MGTVTGMESGYGSRRRSEGRTNQSCELAADDCELTAGEAQDERASRLAVRRFATPALFTIVNQDSPAIEPALMELDDQAAMRERTDVR